MSSSKIHKKQYSSTTICKISYSVQLLRKKSICKKRKGLVIYYKVVVLLFCLKYLSVLFVHAFSNYVSSQWLLQCLFTTRQERQETREYIHLETRVVPLPFDGTEVELVGDPEGLQHEQKFNLLKIYISQKYKYIYPSYKIHNSLKLLLPPDGTSTIFHKYF